MLSANFLRFFALCAVFARSALSAEFHDPDILPGWLGEVHQVNSEKYVRDEDGNAFSSQKIVQLSWKPRAFLYKGFLSHDECDHLIQLAETKLTRSSVVGKLGYGRGVVSDYRTSSGMFIPRKYDPIVSRIEERISKWTFLPQEHGEDLQVLRYKNGQKYNAHLDTYKVSNDSNFGGYRTATVLMYLSDVARGGETVFPNAENTQVKDATWSECGKSGLGVKPVKGNAILFFSLHPDGVIDTKSMHTACPVVDGTKWAAVKWIHEHKFHVSPFRDPSKCLDEHPKCGEWAEAGECVRNPEFMIWHGLYPGSCRKSCNACKVNSIDS